MKRLSAGRADLEEAARLLAAGKLVAFPTETVYGLGADAANPEAVAAMFRAKGRPADHPVIVHLPDAEAMREWAVEIPEAAWKLASAFWPGPLTLVLRRAPGVSDAITGGQDTVGVRVPGNAIARSLLATCGIALAAPSANRFGRISPTTADHVMTEFGDEVAAVIDGGRCEVGVESTIVDLTGSEPRLLRPGMIGASALGDVLGRPLLAVEEGRGPRASGRLASHYAPRTPLVLVGAAELSGRVENWRGEGVSLVVLAPTSAADDPGARPDWLEMPAEPRRYARALYARLREADERGADLIVVQAPPDEDAWRAIIDRLQRAAAESSK